MKKVKVFVDDQYAGILEEQIRGSKYRFSYTDNYHGEPVSLLMPVIKKTFEYTTFPPFFDGLLKHITSGPIVAMVIEGKNAIAAVSQTVGATNPVNAAPGTIRADLCSDMGRNVVHRSDSPVSAKREIDLFFKPEELISNWHKALDKWVFE